MSVRTLICLFILGSVSVGAQVLSVAEHGTGAVHLTGTVGDTLHLEVRTDLAGLSASGVSLFVRFPDAFEIVDAVNSEIDRIEPFAQADLFSGAVEFANSVIPARQRFGLEDGYSLITYAAVLGPGPNRARRGSGAVATFRLRCLAAIQNGAIDVHRSPIHETKLALSDGHSERNLHSGPGLTVDVGAANKQIPFWSVLKHPGGQNLPVNYADYSIYRPTVDGGLEFGNELGLPNDAGWTGFESGSIQLHSAKVAQRRRRGRNTIELTLQKDPLSQPEFRKSIGTWYGFGGPPDQMWEAGVQALGIRFSLTVDPDLVDPDTGTPMIRFKSQNLIWLKRGSELENPTQGLDPELYRLYGFVVLKEHVGRVHMLDADFTYEPSDTTLYIPMMKLMTDPGGVRIEPGFEAMVAADLDPRPEGVTVDANRYVWAQIARDFSHSQYNLPIRGIGMRNIDVMTSGMNRFVSRFYREERFDAEFRGYFSEHLAKNRYVEVKESGLWDEMISESGLVTVQNPFEYSEIESLLGEWYGVSHTDDALFPSGVEVQGVRLNFERVFDPDKQGDEFRFELENFVELGPRAELEVRSEGLRPEEFRSRRWLTLKQQSGVVEFSHGPETFSSPGIYRPLMRFVTDPNSVREVEEFESVIRSALDPMWNATPYTEDRYALPALGVDPGEPIESALVKELGLAHADLIGTGVNARVTSFHRADRFHANYNGSTANAVEEASVPKGFALDANYPNPFNPATIISFTLPVDSHVTIEIYNVAGQLVRTLVDRNRRAGIYSATWDGRTDDGHIAGSGAYVYRVRADAFRYSRLMTLLK